MIDLSSRFRPRSLAPLGFVLAYAACGLFIALTWFPIGDLAVESDFFAELGPAAQAIAAGEISVHNHPYKGPMHGLILAGLHGVLQPIGVGWYRAALVLSLLSAAGALLLVYRMVRQLAGKRSALAAMILTGAVYEVFLQSHKASSDPLFLLLCVAVVAVVFTPDRARAGHWLLAGALAGAAFLTRYIGASLLLWLLLQALTCSNIRSAGRFRRSALVLAGWLLLAGPWFGLSLKQAGTLLETRNVENIARTFEPVIGSDASRSATSVAEIIAHDPLGVLRHYLTRVPQTLRQDANHLVGEPMAFVALLGLVALVVRLRDRRAWRWLAAGGLYLLAVSWVFYLPRFMLPQAPIYAMLVSLALFSGQPCAESLDPSSSGTAAPRGPAWDRQLAAFWTWRRFLPAWIVLAALLAFQVYHCQVAVRYYKSEQPLHLQGAIAYLTAMAAGRPDGPRPVLLARTAHAAFHAGCSYRPYPRRDLSAGEFLDLARARGANFILVGPVERRLAQNYLFLDDLAGYDGLHRSFNDGANAVFALDPDAADFGRDRLAAAMADTIAAQLERSALSFALDTGYELMQRHLRARRYREARAVVVELLTYLESKPDHDRDIAQRMRYDLNWLTSLSDEQEP